MIACTWMFHLFEAFELTRCLSQLTRPPPSPPRPQVSCACAAQITPRRPCALARGTDLGIGGAGCVAVALREGGSRPRSWQSDKQGLRSCRQRRRHSLGRIRGGLQADLLLPMRGSIGPTSNIPASICSACSVGVTIKAARLLACNAVGSNA